MQVWFDGGKIRGNEVVVVDDYLKLRLEEGLIDRG